MNRRIGLCLSGVGLFCGLGQGCFDDFRDRDCKENNDCFPDEVCSKAGRCETSTRADASGGAGGMAAAPTRKFEVRVYGRSDGMELPSATVNFDDNHQQQCDCPASKAEGPCDLEVPVTGTIRLCAHAYRHRPCAIPEVPTALGAKDIVLDACLPDDPCEYVPGCGCEGLPTCGTL